MIAIVIGVAAGVGVLVAASAFGTRQTLRAALGGHRSSPDFLIDFSPHQVRDWASQRFDREWIRDLVGPDLASDLAVGGSNTSTFAFDCAVRIVGCWGGVALFRVLDPDFYLVAGGRAVIAAVVLTIMVIAASVSDVRVKAKRRRREMLEAVASYVEFTRLAAQTRPIEGAMSAAVRCGATWPFVIISNVFAASQRRNEPPWAGLAELGRTFEIADLVELAGALEVAATEGTRIQDTLSAKSQSLRRRLTADEIREAESRTEQLNVPMTALGLCIFVLVIAPALLAF